MDQTAADYVKEKMPQIGLGTYQMRAEPALFEVIKRGFELGYRFIDTAQCYGNEAMIGRILQRLFDPQSPDFAKLKRSDIFITSKVSPANQVRLSLEHLQTDYLDLVLIHWPGASKYVVSNPKNKVLRRETWLELERLQKEGLVRATGVSNYTVTHLNEMLEYASILPVVNQCEYHPHFAETYLVDFCKLHNIHFQAYSSFGSPDGVDDLFSDPKITTVAEKYSTSVPQFLLAWALSQGISVLPRTRSISHLETNWKAQGIFITKEDINDVISKKQIKYCWNPSAVA
ncbi:hypothetical protein L596_024361 [Steinernema carpocapsae]|uniref:NADP-dependent oxidoreductase domain-containing protein n=1 Tax=Steinernema carpocapsae TaxID=34508 RepID=A0A4U5MGJ2_STECR|nr:hypothetical protein L596_024361 [Steinernema carpocapsae]